MQISDLHIMESAAGFYLGRTYHDEEFHADLPYSRQSGYFRDEETARAALALYPLTRRDCDENIPIYIQENGMEDPKAAFTE